MTRFPTPLHRTVLDEILAELRADADARGVLLAGSLARGTARADSDLDILVVTVDDRPRRSVPRALPVDLLARTAEQWRARFTPSRVGDESWGYAFLDGVILHDPTGVVAALAAEARAAHARYRVPTHIKDHYAWLWRHVRPKMAAVLNRGDPVEVGWAAAVMTNDLVRTVWAANDLPNPSLDLGTVQRHLDDLTVPAGVADRLRDILRAAPAQALRLQLDLVTAVQPHLEPGHE